MNTESTQTIDNQSGPREAELAQVISAAHRTLRTRTTTELATEGIDLMFDEGIVATCRCCRISWRVSRSRFRQIEWWSCPSNCKPSR
jgi:hypothetical protein